MRSLWVVCLFSLLASGCMRTAVVRFWAPASIDVCSLNQIVVLEFAGENGKTISSALSGQLWQNEFYTVVDRTELAQELQLASFEKGEPSTPITNFHDVLGPARAKGIDGVVIGEVLTYECEDKTVRKSIVNGNPRPVTTIIPRFKGSGVAAEFRETVIREATVSVEFRLVDIETGEVRAARKVTHHYEGEVDADSKTLSKPEILDELTQQCVNDIVTMLAPHEAESEIQLALCDVWTRGRRDLKEGNRQAELGNWDVAEIHWQEALDENPTNHAALFNLAVLADHRQNYERAEDLAMQALRLQHKTIYTAGLDTIRKHRAAAVKSGEQRDSRVASTLDDAWR